MTSIYMLTLFDTPFYVGRTKSPKTRLASHLSFKRDQKIPVLSVIDSIKFEVIEEVHKDDAANAESYWTNQLREWGFPVVNKNFLKNKPLKRKKDWICFTKDEIVKINMKRNVTDNDIICKKIGISNESLRLWLKGDRRLKIENYWIICKFYKIKPRDW